MVCVRSHVLLRVSHLVARLVYCFVSCVASCLECDFKDLTEGARTQVGSNALMSELELPHKKRKTCHDTKDMPEPPAPVPASDVVEHTWVDCQQDTREAMVRGSVFA